MKNLKAGEVCREASMICDKYVAYYGLKSAGKVIELASEKIKAIQKMMEKKYDEIPASVKRSPSKSQRRK